VSEINGILTKTEQMNLPLFLMLEGI